MMNGVKRRWLLLLVLAALGAMAVVPSVASADGPFCNQFHCYNK